MCSKSFHTVKLVGDCVEILDQRLLPFKEVYYRYENAEDVAKAIKDMVIRGAPAIGIAAAMGLYVSALSIEEKNYFRFREKFKILCEIMKNARPTAVNLFWAIKRIEKIVDEGESMGVDELKKKLRIEAIKIKEEDIEMNKKMGEEGQKLLQDEMGVLTYCNAGALATGGYGTALGIIRSARENGKKIKVFACETRPYLQGARLTVWELLHDGFDVTLITDNMAGYLMKLKKISVVLVGADRIARNGDTANKIGTYTLALLSYEHNLPFYVVAPQSSIDTSMENGDKIPIEERDGNEVREVFGKKIVPEYVKVLNPAFDVTPAKYISAIITDLGVFYPPYDFSKINKI